MDIARRFAVILIVFLGSVTVACGPTFKKIDSTDNPGGWGGYRPGAAYRTRTSVFLVGNKETGFSLRAPESLSRSSPSKSDFPATVDQYNADPGRWPCISRTIEAGATIRVTNFETWYSMTYSYVHVVAEIEGSEPIKDVYINGISSPAGAGIWRPNPEVLEEVVSGDRRGR